MSEATRSPHATAFGKLILLGEHAVVYGAPALVLGVDLRCEAVVVPGPSGRHLLLLDQRCDAAGTDELARAFCALLDEGGAPENLTVEVRGDLPPGVGLGFSAAAAVAAARAVGALVGDAGDDAVRARAMAWERVFHGNPSGVDVAAAMSGGCTRFVRAEGGAIEVRRIAVRAPLCLAVGLTGTRSSTREMVEGLAALHRAQRPMVERSIDGITSLVDNAVSAVEAGDCAALGELMDMNQMVLAGLMLSTSTIEELVTIARDEGALGAKLTGAGGGGAVVALAGTGEAGDEIAARVVGAWQRAGFDGFATRLGKPSRTESP